MLSYYFLLVIISMTAERAAFHPAIFSKLVKPSFLDNISTSRISSSRSLEMMVRMNCLSTT